VIIVRSGQVRKDKYRAGRLSSHPAFVFFLELFHFIEALPRRVAGVQQLVGQVAVGLAEELLVQLDDLGVVVALAHGLALVLGVQGLRALFLVGVQDVVVLVGQEHRAHVGLAAAVDAAAGAAHDLDELVLALARADLVQQHLGALHARGDGHVHDGAVDVDGRLADARVVAAHGGELDGLRFLAGQLEVDRAQGRLPTELIQVV